MRILFDQVGYRPADEKRLLIEAPAGTHWTSVELLRLPDGETVWRGKPVFEGGVDGWSCGPWWSVDVTAVSTPGRYALAWEAGGRRGQSEGLVIGGTARGADLVSELLFYFKSQRSSGLWDAADRRAPRVGDGVRRDVHGGWYDAAGDASKYLSHLSYANVMNPQQTPLVVWVLARAWHLYRAAGAPAFFVERLRDEALWGADWLVRMQDPEGFWYVTLFDRWTKDPAQRELCSYRTQKGEKHDDYQAGWRQGGGMAAAALALASTLGDGGDFSSADYVRAGREGFLHLLDHGRAYLDDGKENVIDDTCALLAAAELLAAAPGEARIGEERDRRLERLGSRRRESEGRAWLAADDDGERSWFHASDAGLPMVALLRAAELDPGRAGAARTFARDLVLAQLALGTARDNPFRYPPHWVKTPGTAGHLRWFYPHDNPSGYWWQGENARLASLAAAAFGAAAFAGDPDASRMRRAAAGWISWIFGANPFDVCMLQGRGRHNPHYEDGMWNAPGGVCNGITSGFDDENDIAFAPEPAALRPDQRWRWTEQWLPHAAWLLYGLVLADTGRVS